MPQYPGTQVQVQPPQVQVQPPQVQVQPPQVQVQPPQVQVQPPQVQVQQPQVYPAPAPEETVAVPEQKVTVPEQNVTVPEQKVTAPDTTVGKAPDPDVHGSHSDGTVIGDGVIVPLGPDDIPYITPKQSTKADPNIGFFGHPMNRVRLKTIAEKLNMIGPDGFAQSLSRLGYISADVPGNAEENIRRDSAIYSAMATAAKLTLLPIATANEATGGTCFTGAPSENNETLHSGKCDKLSKCYGRLKGFAVQNNLAKVKAELENCGGSQKGLSDEELMYLWGLNEHHNLHCCSFTDPQGHQLHHGSHLSSLNEYSMRGLPMCGGDETPKKCTVGDEEITIRCDHPKPWDKASYDDAKGNGSICEKGWMGFHNDTGMWPEWPAIRAAFNFMDKVKPYRS